MSNIITLHINYQTSPIFYHFTPETLRSAISQFTPAASPYDKIRPLSLKSTLQLLEPRGSSNQFARRKTLTRRANQRASSGHVIVCCHHVDPRVTIATRLLLDTYTSKIIYNINHNPTFAALPPPPAQTCSKQGANVCKPLAT